MKLRNKFMLTIYALAAVPILLGLCVCDSARLVRPPMQFKYTLEGVLVKDLSEDESRGVVRIERDSATAAGLEVVVNSTMLAFDTLTFSEPVYTDVFGTAGSLSAGSAVVMFEDTAFGDTLFVTVPGSLSISSIAPTQVGPGDHVSLSWTGSANANGYVVAAVNADSAYEGVGWTQFVDLSITQATINDSAFFRTTFQGEEPNPGKYYIFVYAYTGSPDSALSELLLPVPFPASLADNIDTREVNGHLGGIVVSPLDSINVLAAP